VTCVVFLCTANLCRSPMAAALLEDRLERRGIEIEVVSAGLLEADRPASEGSVRALHWRGLDLGDHRSRRVGRDLISSSTLVLGMEHRHVQEAVLLEPSAWPRSFSLREFVRRASAVGPRRREPLEQWIGRVHGDRTVQEMVGAWDDDIADPYGRSDDEYRDTADELDELVGQLFDLAWPKSADPKSGGEE